MRNKQRKDTYIGIYRVRTLIARLIQQRYSSTIIVPPPRRVHLRQGSAVVMVGYSGHVRKHTNRLEGHTVTLYTNTNVSKESAV